MKKKYVVLIIVSAIVPCVAVGWYVFHNTPVTEKQRAFVASVVAKDPRVKPLYDAAMADGTLTTYEAHEIVTKATDLLGK